MTREEMIDIIITDLMLSKNTGVKEDAIEAILRHGWKGYENYTDEELKQEIDTFDSKRIEGLLICAELIKSERENLALQKSK